MYNILTETHKELKRVTRVRCLQIFIFLSTIFGNPSLQSTHEFKAPKPCEVLQRFFANLNGSMKLLRSERPGISFFAKVVQLLALKCGTGLMFPEKNCCIHRPRRIEAV